MKKFGVLLLAVVLGGAVSGGIEPHKDALAIFTGP